MIEFQKMRLPYAHILIILRPEYKIMSVDQYDIFVSTEISNLIRYPYLHQKSYKTHYAWSL